MEKTTSVEKAKRKLLSTTVIWVTILFAIILIQTILGEDKFRDNQVIRAWYWFFLVSVPLLLTIISVFFFYEPENRKLNSVFLTVTQYLFRIYFLATIGIILYQPLTNWSLIELFQKSRVALVPMQLLLVGITIALMLGSKRGAKEAPGPVQGIDPEQIPHDNLFEGKSMEAIEQIKNDFAPLKENLEEDLQHEAFEEVFATLLAFLRKHQLQDNEVLDLERRYRRTKRLKIRNQLTDEEVSVAFSKISGALLTILDEIA